MYIADTWDYDSAADETRRDAVTSRLADQAMREVGCHLAVIRMVAARSGVSDVVVALVLFPPIQHSVGLDNDTIRRLGGERR